MTQNLPSLNPIPDDIEVEIQRLLHNPAEPAVEAWLLELIKNSGHRSLGDDMRWRLLCMVWLAIEFDVNKSWPYLMWLNMNEPTISTHLSEILIEAVDQMEAHLQMAHWLAHLEDERLVTFFKDFQVVPAQRKMQPLLTGLFAHPTHPKVGTWLAAFCEGTRYNDRAYMRSWRLLTAAWYAAGFNPDQGLIYLKELIDSAEDLTPADNKLLTDAASETNGLTPMIQMIAGCSDPTVKAILKDFGHPDLTMVAETALQASPDYRRLAKATEHAAAEVETFKRTLACLEQAQFKPKATNILDLACGPLAPQTVLLNSAGYKTLGVDLDIPPGYLPLTGLKGWFSRYKHNKAWQAAAAAYYQTLAQQADLEIRWGKVNLKLADPTRLEFDSNSFDVIICVNHLQHAPDVEGLLSEAARVLKPGGLFLADIQPYTTLNGAGLVSPNMAWQHLRKNTDTVSKSGMLRNKWREAQFQKALENCFSIEQWLPEVDPQAQSQLTAEIKAELPDYSEEELTRKQIWIVARK